MFIEIIIFDFLKNDNALFIIFNFLAFLLIPIIAIIICVIFTVDYYGYRKRFFCVVVYKSSLYFQYSLSSRISIPPCHPF